MIVEVLLALLVSILAAFYVGYYLFGLAWGKSEPPVGDETYVPKVSLVVATFNEENAVEKKIENLTGINYPRDRMEIILVDSSTDATREIIKKFIAASDINVKLFEEEERRGLASALNKGYAMATGEIVIKTDCDIPIHEDSVREIVKQFHSPSVGAVSGAIRIVNQSDTEIGYRSIFERLRLAEANLDSTYLFNPFCAFRKELIQPIDQRSVADDAELALKIRKSGFKTSYSPTAVAYETSPTSLSERVRQKSRRAQGHIRLIIQNLDVLLNPKYSRFGLFIFPANFFMMILSPWLILLSLVICFIYLLNLAGLIISSMILLLFLVLIAAAYVKSTPKILAGFLDSQLNLLVGLFKLVTKGPDFRWTKNKRDKNS